MNQNLHKSKTKNIIINDRYEYEQQHASINFLIR